MIKRKGFTLIEVLIIVAILGMLAIALLLSMKNQRQKAEDARIKTDLQRLKIAFEDYYNDNNCYPPTAWFDSPDDCGSELLKPYLNAIPCDPKTDEPYVLEHVGDQCSAYRLYAMLENSSDPDATGLCTSSGGSTLGNYGVGSSNVTIGIDCAALAGPSSSTQGGGYSPGPSGSILPSPTPGTYACQGTVCNNFFPGDPLAAGCPISFANSSECQSYCDLNNPAYQCP